MNPLIDKMIVFTVFAVLLYKPILKLINYLGQVWDTYFEEPEPEEGSNKEYYGLSKGSNLRGENE